MYLTFGKPLDGVSYPEDQKGDHFSVFKQMTAVLGYRNKDKRLYFALARLLRKSGEEYNGGVLTMFVVVQPGGLSIKFGYKNS